MAKIIFLINSLAIGGAETVALRISQKLKIPKIFLIENHIEFANIKNNVILLSKHNKNSSSLLKTILIPFYSYKLSRYVSSETIIISFLERANYINIITKLLTKHKCVISVRVDLINEHIGLKSFNKYLIKLLYPRADLIIAVSKGVKESLINLGIPEEKVRVIYNPYSIEEIETKAKENIEHIFLKFPYLINVGRLTKQKGQWYLLRIFKELKKLFPELRFLILGEGELLEYLVELSKGLGLKTYVWSKDVISENYDVYFMGPKRNPFKYISRAKLFVFSSLWEGFPNVLVESMGCGVPVLSADCKSGPREILAPDTDFRKQTHKPEFAKYGILMPVFERKLMNIYDPLTEEERSWVDIIAKLLKDKEILNKYSNVSKKRAAHFHIKNIIKFWFKFLEEVKTKQRGKIKNYRAALSKKHQRMSR